MLPLEMKKMEDPNTFKTKTKEWIWENIPSSGAVSGKAGKAAALPRF